MKVIKKNQLVIIVISLMLITAGYLNYGTTYDNEAMDTSTSLEENINLASLGDAELVNSDVIEESKKENEEVSTSQEQENTEQKQEEKQMSAEVEDYFTASKLERDVMYSQMIERYQEIITSNTQVAEQKTIARRRN